MKLSFEIGDRFTVPAWTNIPAKNVTVIWCDELYILVRVDNESRPVLVPKDNTDDFECIGHSPLSEGKTQ